eukprot:gene22399-27026_t
MGKGPKYYAVARGARVGVFSTWDEASRYVTGYPGAVHKSFPSREQADRWLETQLGSGAQLSTAQPPSLATTTYASPLPTVERISHSERPITARQQEEEKLARPLLADMRTPDRPFTSEEEYQRWLDEQCGVIKRPAVLHSTSGDPALDRSPSETAAGSYGILGWPEAVLDSGGRRPAWPPPGNAATAATNLSTSTADPVPEACNLSTSTANPMPDASNLSTSTADTVPDASNLSTSTADTVPDARNLSTSTHRAGSEMVLLSPTRVGRASATATPSPGHSIPIGSVLGAAKHPLRTNVRSIVGVPVCFPPDIKPHPPQMALMSKVITALQTSQHALLESPTGTGKSLALLCSALAWQEQEQAKLLEAWEKRNKERGPHSPDEGDTRPRAPRIYLCSRTHSQLHQLLQELKRTPYSPKMTVLGSRRELCHNQK